MLALLFVETLATNPKYFFAVVISVIASICVHELAHGVVAVWKGDRTPIEMDRLTLNPVVHMGIPSLLLLLMAGIAWGAMPINPSRMRGRYAESLVALAGPASNVLLALLALTGLGLWLRSSGIPDPGGNASNLQYLLRIFGYANVHLALFNMIPFPPLDGARVVANIFPSVGRRFDAWMSSGALLVVLILFSVAATATQVLAMMISSLYLGLIVA